MTVLVNKLRNRVRIESVEQVPRMDGNFDRQYNFIARVWAAVANTGRGNMYVGGKDTEEVASHKITIRFMRGLHKDLFISMVREQREFTEEFNYDFNGPLMRRFRIHKIKNVGERNEYLEIMVEEIERNFDKGAYHDN